MQIKLYRASYFRRVLAKKLNIQYINTAKLDCLQKLETCLLNKLLTFVEKEYKKRNKKLIINRVINAKPAKESEREWLRDCRKGNDQTHVNNISSH